MRFTAGGLSSFILLARSTLCVALPNPVLGSDFTLNISPAHGTSSESKSLPEHSSIAPRTFDPQNLRVELTVVQTYKPGHVAFHVRLINDGDDPLYCLAATPRWINEPAYPPPLALERFPSEADRYAFWSKGKRFILPARSSTGLTVFFYAQRFGRHNVQVAYDISIAHQVSPSQFGRDGIGSSETWTTLTTLKSNVVTLDVPVELTDVLPPSTDADMQLVNGHLRPLHTRAHLVASFEISKSHRDMQDTEHLMLAISLKNTRNGHLTILDRQPIVNGVPTIRMAASNGALPHLRDGADLTIPRNEDCQKWYQEGAEILTIPGYKTSQVFYNLAKVLNLKTGIEYGLSIAWGSHVYACYIPPLGGAEVIKIPVVASFDDIERFGPLIEGGST